MKELLLRTLTGILLIILIAGSILLGALPFLGIILVIYLLGLRELFSLFPGDQSRWRWVSALPGFVLLMGAFAVLTYQWNYLFLALPLALWLLYSLIKGFESSTVLSFFWLALPLSGYLSLGWQGTAHTYQSVLPLSLISLVWINDTLAYVIGSLMGKHKLTPKISPGKSWEGLIGGMLFTLFGGWMIFRITDTFNLEVWLIASFLISTLGLLGDLFESGLKRRRTVKNAGEILPGHGGILDRFDSLLFVAPGVWVLFMLLSHYQ